MMLTERCPQLAARLEALRKEMEMPENAQAVVLAQMSRHRLRQSGFVSDDQIALELDLRLGLHDSLPATDDEPGGIPEGILAYSRYGRDVDVVLFNCAKQYLRNPEAAQIDMEIWALDQMMDEGPIVPPGWAAGC